jgi:hypothetical protein
MGSSKSKKNYVVSVSITLLIIVMLILSGPASAIKIVLSPPTGGYSTGDPVTFIVDVEFQIKDLIPIENISVTGLPLGNLLFYPNGTKIEGAQGYTVIRTSEPYHGYGYGYGYDAGYGYNFGYGYGYGYIENGPSPKLTYEIYISGLSEGTYSGTGKIDINTGNVDKPAFSASQAYSFNIVPTPLIISNITNTTPTADSVTIIWDTDKESDSIVKYGTASGTYTNEQSNAAMVTSHSVMLTGLSSNTTYYFVVNSTDANNKSNQSNEYSFRTAMPPVSLSAHRTLSGNMCPGSTVSVTIDLNVSGSPVDGLGIKENVSDIPSHWTINVHNGGNYIPANKMVEYNWEGGNISNKTVTYEIAIPESATLGEQHDITGIAQITSGEKITTENIGTDTITVVECPEGIYLQEGWNLFSVPGVLDNDSVEYVLAGVDYENILWYDPVSKTWVIPATIKPLTGYAINVNTDQIITNLEYIVAIPPSRQLYTGWNLVGLTGAKEKSAEFTFKVGGIDDNYSKVWGPWDPINKIYIQYGYNQNVFGDIPGGESPPHIYSENYIMKPFEGHWVLMESDATLDAIG